jgi:predicted flap endonuclease-1-like 5' DNA nuclease
MKRVDNLNAPSLYGWIFAAVAGVLAFLVAKVVGGFDYTTSGFFAAVITGLAGLIIGMPWGASDRIPKPEVEAEGSHAAAAAAAPAPVAAPVAPMAEAAPLMAAPMVSSAIVAEPVAPAAVKAPAAAPAPKAETKPKVAAAPKAEAKPKAAAKPKAEPAPVAAAPAGGSKPKALKAARKGVADDLKVIEGIGPAMEKLLNEGGVFHIDQIAAWGPAEVEWMDGNLKGFKGRVTRDKWVAQAKLIGEVGLEEFLRRAKTNDY